MTIHYPDDKEWRERIYFKGPAPNELKLAIDSVMSKGFYYSEIVSGKLVHSIAMRTTNGKILIRLQVSIK